MEIRERFLSDLEQIQSEVVELTRLVEKTIGRGFEALAEGDTAGVQEISEEVKKIRAMKRGIDNTCITLIAREQPVAHDLRMIMTTIEIVSHIERIGDHALHLAEAAGKIRPAIVEQTLPYMKKMAGIGLEMLQASIAVFTSGELDDLRGLIDRDKEIDSLNIDLYNRIVELMENEEDSIKEGTELMFLNRFMERLGDHAVQVCDWISFANTGKRITA